MSEDTPTHQQTSTQVESPVADSDLIGWKHPESAIRDGRAHLLLWSITALGLILDLWSKAWAFSSLAPGEQRTWVPHVLDLQLSRNPGALFGMGSGMVVLFVVASVAALGFVMFMFAGASRKQRVVQIALACILSGAFGNLYDRVVERFDMVEFHATATMPVWRLIGRVVDEPTDDTIRMASWLDPDRVHTYRRDAMVGGVRRVGVVRDFLKIVWKWGDTELWPWVFNVADVFLVIGVGLLLIGFWRRPHGLQVPNPGTT